ncbi:uncharacterized protein PAC_16708 [Phialocephala subalpina]|uniref:T6SS Phospholipase effector Tle1-like catalytic domain-containing protein n=1 Tax=Phialocephala subalpina TaxID=576137 RepID=A0A1L7XPA8_9HELO|nr:uncharacterized protein PAC_16708 [Phialocephala subalpina]
MQSSTPVTARLSSQAGPSDPFAEILAKSIETGRPKQPVQKHALHKKRIIVCCDGTWNSETFPTPLTNVSLLSRCILPFDDDIPQVVLYQPGIGTGTSKIGNVVEGATGRGLEENICEAYSFVCHNYAALGDEIFLLGFSRGAFTVRCIAQLINDVGVLTKVGLPFLLPIFSRWARRPKTKKEDGITWEGLCDTLREGRRHSHFLRRNVDIKACAVWDTVGSLGIPMIGGLPQPGPRRFKFVNSDLCPRIIHAFQALSLHERRRHFRPIVWKKSESPTSRTKTLKQCWFLGYHSDVGGGVDEPILSHIALAWMIRQLQDRDNRCYLAMELSNLWNFNTFKTTLTEIPLDLGATESSVVVSEEGEHGTDVLVSAELDKSILDAAFAKLLDETKDEDTDPKDDYIKLKDSKKEGVFLFGGKSYRRPGTRFWGPLGLAKITQPKYPDERIHFTVRMLLHQRAVLPPESLIGSKTGMLGLRPNENQVIVTEKFWHLPAEGNSKTYYEIKEENITKEETRLLANLLMSEKCRILVGKGPLETQGDLPQLNDTELGQSRSMKTRLEPIIDKLLWHLDDDKYQLEAHWSYNDYQKWKDSNKWYKIFSRRKGGKGKQPANRNQQQQ